MRKPSLPLRTLREKYLSHPSSKIIIRENAARGARELGWGRNDIIAALRQLREVDCYKTELHRTRPLCWIDYYRAEVNGERIYCHFYLDVDNDIVVINSFKPLDS